MNPKAHNQKENSFSQNKLSADDHILQEGSCHKASLKHLNAFCIIQIKGKESKSHTKISKQIKQIKPQKFHIQPLLYTWTDPCKSSS